MQPDVHRSITAYDALNRPVTCDRRTERDPARPTTRRDCSSRSKRTSGERSLTSRCGRPFVTNIDYDAKGQRTLIVYGNLAETRYRYDPRRSGSSTSRRRDPRHRRGCRTCTTPTTRSATSPDPRRRAATDLLPQPPGRSQQRLHLRPALPADDGDRPGAPGPGRRRATGCRLPRRRTTTGPA